MRTTESRSSPIDSAVTPDSRPRFTTALIVGQNTPVLTCRERNTGTLFGTRCTAEVRGDYTGARSPARNFCDSTGRGLRAVASPRVLERFNYLNPRAESAALGRGPTHHAPRKRAPSLSGRLARAATDFGICLELSGQVIASHGFFMTARKSCGTRENHRSAFGSRGCHLFAPRVAFAQQGRW